MRDRPWYIGMLLIVLFLIYTWGTVRCFQALESKKMQAQMSTIHLSILDQKIKYCLSVGLPLLTVVFMWEGHNWARVVYITWGIANYLLEAIVVPSTRELFPGVTIWAFACILLLLPRPRDYFLLPQFYT